MSRGKTTPFLDERGRPLPGSISEKAFIDVNGARQGLFIKGRSDRNPVLLWLHGGIPDTFLTARYPTGLEDLFTVVWWEQRGSGISFDPNIPPESMTLDQFIADTLAVTNYLRNRFGKERIYLMGHSGGSFVGIQAVAQSPEQFAAYIGVAQMSNQLRSEKLAYDFMLEEFRKSGDRAMVRKLESTRVTPSEGTPRAYLALRDPGMHRLGIGTMHDMRSIFTGLIWPSLTFSEYTLAEKVNLWRAKMAAGPSLLWAEMLATDMADKVAALSVPAYFLHGMYDYTCAYTEARTYVSKLEAPTKAFYTFEHSAHSPMFEEAAKARQILQQDVLTGRTSLADAT
jgi:pimeloyl-ACP methyl ester carboxylesterase